MLKRIAPLTLIVFGSVIAYAWSRWRQIQCERQPAPLADTLLRNPDTVLSLRRNSNTLVVEWDKPTTSAKVYLTEASQTVDYDAPMAIVYGQRFALLPDIEETIRYDVEVVFEDGTVLKHRERILPLKSVPNFRDIGGYTTADGQQVCWDKVYRASALNNLSSDDAQTLQDLNVKLVCDVRTIEEQTASPDTLPETIRGLSAPPSTKANRWVQLGKVLFQRGFLEDVLLELYQAVMIDENPQVFRAIFEEIASDDNLPIVIHCAAGKDRTGISIALLLSLLGVPDETIVADYTLSNNYYNFFRTSHRKALEQLSIVGLSEQDFNYLLIADGDHMQQTLDYVRQTYGSIEGYLRDYVGLSDETLASIKANLLHPVA